MLSQCKICIEMLWQSKIKYNNLPKIGKKCMYNNRSNKITVLFRWETKYE